MAAPNTNGCETNIQTSTTNCGGCFNACDSTHSTGTTTCVSGACHYGACASGYSDCNATTAPNVDGCETNTQTSATNCGGCNNVCDTTHSNGVSCVSGSCQHTSCAANYADCVPTAPDLNGCDTAINTPTHCGNCAATCPTLNGSPAGCTCTATDGGVACETVHNNGPSSLGYGQTWGDCFALNTYNSTQATAACVAYKGAGNCSTGWTCGSGATKVTQPVACDNACTTCWAYGTTGGTYPTTAGTVTACTCPNSVMSVGTWN
jgi:hypothetical protein